MTMLDSVVWMSLKLTSSQVHGAMDDECLCKGWKGSREGAEQCRVGRRGEDGVEKRAD